MSVERVCSRFKGICRLYKQMRRRCASIHTPKTTHMKGHTEASGSEQRESALNGDEEVLDGYQFFLPYPACYGAPLALMLATLLRMRCTKMTRT
jgi:hypothetical protein